MNVITSAKTAELEFATSQIASTVTLEISGNQGVQVLTFTSGTPRRRSRSRSIAARFDRREGRLINSANAAVGHQV